MIYVTPDEKLIYTTNVGSATVSILEKITLPPMGPPPGMRPTANTAALIHDLLSVGERCARL